MSRALCMCRETGNLARPTADPALGFRDGDGGSCPDHGGDACLVSIDPLAAEVRIAVLEAALRKEQEREHAAKCGCRLDGKGWICTDACREMRAALDNNKGGTE